MNKLSQFFNNLRVSISGIFSPVWQKVKNKYNEIWQKIQSSKYKNWILASISVLSIVIIVGGGFLLTKTSFFQNLFNRKKIVNPWTPYKPSPQPLAHGKQTYTISGSTKGAPKITQATVDPIDPDKNAPETWTVKAIEPNNLNITEVSVKVFTDENKSQEINLQRVDGHDQDGTWQGSLTLNNTYDYTYVAVLTATNDDNKIQTVTLTFR